MPHQFRSLRVRLLLPLLTVALLASVAVAVGSYLLGDRWARDQIATRYRGIESTLSRASFPLTRQVVASIAELTDSELITLSANGDVTQASLSLPNRKRIPDLAATPTDHSTDRLVSIGDQRFRYAVFDREIFTSDQAVKVVVLFDEAQLQASRMRAASLPLVTGLSTVILLTSVTLWLAGRLTRRLSRLGGIVNRIAEGDFDTSVPIGPEDEVGRLGLAVSRMSGQLRQMWTTLQRQQGQKLLHQLAGGLAHQLRNSITGARMAVELHQRHCSDADDTLSVALTQLEQTEGHIRRLLTVASGKQGDEQPQTVGQCLDDCRATLSATAKHLCVELIWIIDDKLRCHGVNDGPSLSAALTNLVLNALQQATRVEVSVARDEQHRLRIDVVDNGSGPPHDVAAEIFEPFVTSKPEGLGLGLPLVARAARRLGGEVEWTRDGERTRFTLTARLTAVDA